MAENKQYISQVQQGGTVMISEDVIATIVTHAVSEVEGVVAMGSKTGADIVELFGKKNWGRVHISDDNTLTIDCNLILTYGQSVVTVATAVQSAVTAALEAMTGIKVAAVNANVCGITRQ